MKTNFKSFALAVAVLLGMGACSNELDEQLQQTEGQPLTFNFSIHHGATTKTTTNPEDRVTSWASGDEVGLFVYEKDAVVGTEAAVQANVKLTFDGEKWTSATPIYAGADYDFYAYYPYQASVSNPTQISLTAKANQSQEADYGLSDVLAAPKATVTAAATQLDMTFKHMFSLVEVRVSGDLVTAAPANVVLKNVQTAATLNLVTNEATVSGEAGDVIPQTLEAKENVYAYRAVVPAQNVAKDTHLVQLQNGEKHYAFKYSTDVAYEAGKYRTLNVLINKAKVELTIPTPGITPWEPSEPGTGEGGTEEIVPPVEVITTFKLDIANADVSNLKNYKQWNNTGANACEDKATSYWFRRENAATDAEFKTNISVVGSELVLSRTDKPSAWMGSSVGYHCSETFEQGIYKVTISTSSEPVEGSYGLAISNNEDKMLYIISAADNFEIMQPARSIKVKENAVFYLDLTRWTDIQNSNKLTADQVKAAPVENISHLNIYLYNYNREEGVKSDIKISSLSIEKYVPAAAK